MMSISAVIFDFNGVLVDDESVHFALFRELLLQEGVVITERDYHDRYLGYDDRGCFETALTDAGQSVDRERIDDLIAKKARRYVEVASQGLQFFAHANQALKVTSTRWPVAICSGALRPEIEYALDRLGCLDRVTAIISAENMTKGKPDPEGYRLTLAALRSHVSNSPRARHLSPQTTPSDLDAGNCLVIEDSLAGIVSAKGAGMRTIGVPNTYTIKQLRDAGADDVIDGLAILTPEWIERRFTA